MENEEKDNFDVVVSESRELVSEDLVNKIINPKYEIGIRLWMTGIEMEEVSKRVGVATQTLYSFKCSPQGQELVQKIRSDMDEEFRNLQVKVNKILSEALDHPEVAISLTAVNIFLRATKGREFKVELTAEDIVQKLMGGKTS